MLHMRWFVPAAGRCGMGKKRDIIFSNQNDTAYMLFGYKRGAAVRDFTGARQRLK